MRAEMIMDAIGYLDDAVLIDYDNLSRYTVNRKNKYIRWIAAAACVCFVAMAAFFLLSETVEKDPVRLGVGNWRPQDHFTNILPDPKESESPLLSGIPTESPTIVPEKTPGAAETPGLSEGTPAVPDTPRRTPKTTEYPAVMPGTTQAVPDMPQMTKAPGQSQNTEGTPRPSVTPAPEPTEKPAETDWESRWTYFIARLDSEAGNGIMAGIYPSAGNDDLIATEEPSWEGPMEEPSENAGALDDAYFIENSYWTFVFDYADCRYKARRSALSKEDVGAYLGQIDLNISETALKGLHFQKELPAYAIRNVSTKAALAVCVNPGEYYLFVNLNYAPGSLREFLTDFNLMPTTELTKIASFHNTHHGLEMDFNRMISDETGLWNALFSYDSIFVESVALDSYDIKVRIEMNNDFYAFYDIVLTLREEGYIDMQVFGRHFIFHADPEILDSLCKFIQDE